MVGFSCHVVARLIPLALCKTSDKFYNVSAVKFGSLSAFRACRCVVVREVLMALFAVYPSMCARTIVCNADANFSIVSGWEDSCGMWQSEV